MKFSEYKIGDRVVAIGSIDRLPLDGMHGTIICKDHNSVGIEFDEPFEDGHDCIGGKFGYCRWCYDETEIKLVEKYDEYDDPIEINPDEDEILILNSFLSTYNKPQP